jgi:hypothetical protein
MQTGQALFDKVYRPVADNMYRHSKAIEISVLGFNWRVVAVKLTN